MKLECDPIYVFSAVFQLELEFHLGNMHNPSMQIFTMQSNELKLKF